MHRNTINPFFVFKSSVDLTQVQVNDIFLAKVTYDVTQDSKVVKLNKAMKNRFIAFELQEGTEDLENGIINLSTIGHYHIELYANSTYTNDVSNLTKLYTEKMYLI